MNRGDDLSILPVTAAMKVTERDDLDKVIQGDSLLCSDFCKVAVKLTADRHELLAEAFLLIVASGAEIDAIGRTGDAHDPVFPATLRADEAA